ncbi:MAG: hypothetical protein ABSG49_03865 [Methanoregula sp.]
MTFLSGTFCVDACTARPGAGNLTGICLIELPADAVGKGSLPI